MTLITSGPLRKSGAILTNDASGAGWTQVADTLQCVHLCQQHWIVTPGSGIERGWCSYCNGPVCGQEACMAECKPWEKSLEEIERAARGLR